MSFDNNKSTTKMMYAGKQQQRRTWATKTNNLDNRNLSFEEGCGEQEEEECFDLSHGAHNSNIGICRKQRHCTQRYSDLSGEEPPAVEPSKAESEAAVKAPKKRGRRKKVVATATNKTQSKRLSEAAPSSSVEETKVEPTTAVETTTETEVHKEPKKRGRPKKVVATATNKTQSKRLSEAAPSRSVEETKVEPMTAVETTTETEVHKEPKKRGRPKKVATATNKTKSKPLSEAAPSSSVEETKLEPTTSNETTTETEVHKEPKKRGRSKKVTHIDTRLILSEKRQRTKHNNAFEFSGNNKSGFYGWTTEKRNEKKKQKNSNFPGNRKEKEVKTENF